MRVGELAELLREFPPELPVFFCPQGDGLNEDHIALAPQDAVMNLVAIAQQKAMGFNVGGIEGGDHEDAVVIYPTNVRATE
jgi:hypothetical protein